MGCKNSTDKKPETPPKKESNVATQSPQEDDRESEPLSSFLCLVYPQYAKHTAKAIGDPAIRQRINRAFISTSLDLAKHVYHAKTEAAVKAIQRACKKTNDALAVGDFVHDTKWINDRAIDDVQYQLLAIWNKAMEPARRESISVPEAQSLLHELSVYLPASFVFPREGEVNFTEFCDIFFAKFRTKEMQNLFLDASSGNSEMNATQLLHFLGSNHTTAELAEDTIRSSFGGILCEYNFCAHFLHPVMNGVLDPKRAGRVWQDMTLPLPNYHIRSEIVVSEKQLRAALRKGVRGLLVDPQVRREVPTLSSKRSSPRSPTGQQVSELGQLVDVIYAGSDLSLATLAEIVRLEGFVSSSYPIILAFLPSQNFSVELQAKTAAVLQDVLDDRLARGLMFDGANLTDPRFSPSALQEKVLILAAQAPLQPFVGVYVSDMVRGGIGVRVTDVKEHSPAANAGITKDDWFTHINGTPVEDKERFKAILGNAAIGDELVMRKENLTEVRVIIGGAVPPNVPGYDTALSNRTFLTAHSAKDDPHTPWSTSIYYSLDDVHATKDDFALVRLEESLDKLRAEKDVLSADELGVQFIFSMSEAVEMWARGKFAENGDSGFNLRFNEEEWQPSRWHLRLVAAPPATSGKPLKRTVAGVFGKQCVECSSDQILFDATSVQAVCLLDLEYEGSGFQASLPAALLRTGYRAVPMMEMGTGRKTSALFYVELLE